jgi:secernin
MCDTLAAVAGATASGAVLFAKNSDREYREAQYLELIPGLHHQADARVRLTYVEIAQARQTHTVLLSKPHWIWGAEIGANEHGLVIGNEAIFAKDPASLEPGIIGMDYLRLALERARSVEEGIDTITTLLEQHGQSGKCGFARELAYDNSFILADPGGAKVLETVDREWAVKPVTDYYAISNAMTIEPFRSRREDPTRSASGCHRRARAMEMLGERSGRLQVTDLFRVLRDHKEGTPLPGRTSGPRICSHTRENPLGQTTASWAASLGPSKTLHWVTGTSAPCTGLFKPVFLETGLPDHGPHPGAEADAASLWWRHEKLTNGLDRADEAIRRAFIAERDALEAQLLKRMESCPAPREDFARARRMVEDCWREALAFEREWSERTE